MPCYAMLGADKFQQRGGVQEERADPDHRAAEGFPVRDDRAVQESEGSVRLALLLRYFE